MLPFRRFTTARREGAPREATCGTADRKSRVTHARSGSMAHLSADTACVMRVVLVGEKLSSNASLESDLLDVGFTR